MKRAAIVALGCAAAGCSDETISPLATGPRLSTEPEVIVHFASEDGTGNVSPAGIPLQPANNNLGLVVYHGRTYMGWRTAPSHFASDKTVMNVASEGPDGWRFEGKWELGTDLREPRFLIVNDKLFFWFAVLGKNPYAFEPQGMMQVEYKGSPGEWTEPEWSYLPSFILWRAKYVGDQPWIIGYVGGEHIYDLNGKPIEVHLLTTKDGRTFEPVIPGQPVVQMGGGSETDYEFLDDGTLVAVTRNEAGDEEFGFGSKICRAEPGDLAHWTCKPDKKKYDSPLVLKHDNRIYLVARRNVTEDGFYDLGHTEKSLQDQEAEYQVEYSFNPKRCSLWEVDPKELTVKFLFDLPSRGDTCFASYLPKSDDEVTIYNYTNPTKDDDCPSWPDQCEDLTWWVGQGRPTDIYRIGLKFE